MFQWAYCIEYALCCMWKWAYYKHFILFRTYLWAYRVNISKLLFMHKKTRIISYPGLTTRFYSGVDSKFNYSLFQQYHFLCINKGSRLYPIEVRTTRKITTIKFYGIISGNLFFIHQSRYFLTE